MSKSTDLARGLWVVLVLLTALPVSAQIIELELGVGTFFSKVWYSYNRPVKQESYSATPALDYNYYISAIGRIKKLRIISELGIIKTHIGSDYRYFVDVDGRRYSNGGNASIRNQRLYLALMPEHQFSTRGYDVRVYAGLLLSHDLTHEETGLYKPDPPRATLINYRGGINVSFQYSSQVGYHVGITTTFISPAVITRTDLPRIGYTLFGLQTGILYRFEKG